MAYLHLLHSPFGSFLGELSGLARKDNGFLSLFNRQPRVVGGKGAVRLNARPVLIPTKTKN